MSEISLTWDVEQSSPKNVRAHRIEIGGLTKRFKSSASSFEVHLLRH